MFARLWNIDTRMVEARGTAPLSDEATLDWVGFTDSGIPVVADSKQLVRGLMRAWGNAWTPLADLEQHKKDRVSQQATGKKKKK